MNGKLVHIDEGPKTHRQIVVCAESGEFAELVDATAEAKAELSALENAIQAKRLQVAEQDRLIAQQAAARAAEYQKASTAERERLTHVESERQEIMRLMRCDWRVYRFMHRALPDWLFAKTYPEMFA